jgi:hypothetical protein
MNRCEVDYNTLTDLPGSFAADDSLIVSLTAEGLRIISIDAGGRLRSRGFLRLGERSLGVDGDGTVAYAITTDSLQILDFSNSHAPELLGGIPLVAERVKVLDHDWIIAYDSVVTLINVADRQSPSVVSKVGLGRNNIGRNVAVHDSMMAFACLEGKTQIVVRRGDRLVYAGSLPVRSTDLLWRGDTLLMSGIDSSVTMYGLSDPWHPVMLRSFRTASGPTWSIVSVRDTLLVTGQMSGLYTTDLSTFTVIPGYANSIRRQIIDGRGYVITSDGLFVAIQQESLLGGSWIDNLPVNGDASFYVGDSLIFVAAGNLGLKAFALESTPATISTESAPGSNIFRASVRPNPADESATIDYTTTAAGVAQLALTDALGRVLYSTGQEPETAGNHRISLNLSFLPDGLYFYRIVWSGGTATGAIAVLHR